MKNSKYNKKKIQIWESYIYIQQKFKKCKFKKNKS